MGKRQSRILEDSSRKLSHYEKALVDAITANDFILLEKLLLESGVNTNSLADANGETLLCLSCRLQNYRCTTKLLEFGADPNRESFAPTNLPLPILSAAKYGDLRSVSVLVKHRAMASIKDKISGRTALHYACEFGHDGVVQLMLTEARKGIDVNAPDVDGMTPLHVASHVGPNQRQTVRRAKCVYRLAKIPGVDLDLQNNEGEAALHIAASTGNELAAAILLKKGADPTVDNHYRSDQFGIEKFRPTRCSSLTRRKMARRSPIVPRIRVIAFSGTPDVTAKMAGHITLSNLIGEARALQVMRDNSTVPPLEMLCRLTIRNYMTTQFKPISLLKSIAFVGMQKPIVDFISYKTLVICPNTLEKVHQALGSEVSHFLHDQTRSSAIDIHNNPTSPTDSTILSPLSASSNISKVTRQLSLSTRVLVEALIASERRLQSPTTPDSNESGELPPVQRYGSEPNLLSMTISDTYL